MQQENNFFRNSRTERSENPILKELTTDTTTSDRLEEIAKSSNNKREVIDLIIQHPNASPELLKELIGTDSLKLEPLIKNPALDLVLLENPNFFDTIMSEMSEYEMDDLFHKRKVDGELTLRIINSCLNLETKVEVLYLIAKNKYLGSDAIELLLNYALTNKNNRLLGYLAENPNIGEENLLIPIPLTIKDWTITS